MCFRNYEHYEERWMNIYSQSSTSPQRWIWLLTSTCAAWDASSTFSRCFTRASEMITLFVVYTALSKPDRGCEFWLRRTVLYELPAICHWSNSRSRDNSFSLASADCSAISTESNKRAGTSRWLRDHSNKGSQCWCCSLTNCFGSDSW